MDRMTPQQRSYNMSRIRSKNTRPELTVRKMVHRMGFRYRLHQKNLPGKPDLVLRRHKKVILVHGCFWHGHTCENGRSTPENNRNYWIAKRKYNKKRDRLNERKLIKDGWRVLVLWECETENQNVLRRKLENFLKT